jgi:type IV pilus assembly protein PilC
VSIDVSKYQVNSANALPKEAAEERSWFDFMNRDIQLFGNKLNDKKKGHFYSEMHALFIAGVDLNSALELLEEEQVKAADKQLFGSIKEKVIQGMSLSAAMEDTGKFGNYEIYSIKIGEESGKLKDILVQLSEYYTKRIKLKRQMVAVFTYPVFVLAVSMGVIYFMLNTIVPMFSDVFTRFGGELPDITKVVIALSDGFSTYMLYASLVALSITILVITQRKSSWFRRSTAAIVLRIPVFGKLIRKIYLARFCQSMHLLIASRTPLVEAISMVEKMIGFYPIESSLQQVRAQLLKGESLHKGLSQFSIYDKRMVSLVKVSEEVNQLDSMFERLSNQYQEEVEHQTGIMGTIIEPLMIIFIALFVGLILIAMYLPLFELSTTIG